LEGVQVDQEFELLNLIEKPLWVIKTTTTLLSDLEIKEHNWNTQKRNAESLLKAPPYQINLLAFRKADFP
jgi:hypothetical protein